MTLAENVALPLREDTGAGPDEIADLAQLKLALVGLAGFEHFYPAEISGGMRKRAALARAHRARPGGAVLRRALRRPRPDQLEALDDLILELRDSLGATIVVVTHELPSIYPIADNASSSTRRAAP